MRTIFDEKIDNESPFYTVKNLKRVLGYNGDITTIQSPRNIGKSYACRMLAKEKIAKGEMVGWGRYNRPEAQKALATWQSFAPELTLVKNGAGQKLLMDECTGGGVYIFPWNISQAQKDTDIPFSLIVYDEFIPERYTASTRMLTEFDDWYSVDTSLSRGYHPKKVMVANNIFWQNPFFLHWDVLPFGKGKIAVDVQQFDLSLNDKSISFDSRIVSENVAMSDAMVERQIKQQALRFRSADELKAYYDNATKQEYTRVGACPDTSLPLGRVQFMSGGYYIGFRVLNGVYYLCKITPNSDLATYVSEPEFINLEKRHFRDPNKCSALEQLFNEGKLVFDTVQTLNAFYRFIKNSRRRL